MKTRYRIAQLLLWLAVLGASVWVGGTLYQMLVIVPIWSASPPDSVRAFFLGTKYNETIWNFFGPPYMLARGLPVFGALALAWPSAQHRKWLLVAALCGIFTVFFTLAYIYPINNVLFMQAGGNHTAEEIQAMARTWIWADRVRFGIGVFAFFTLLRAFTIPFARESRGV